MDKAIEFRNPASLEVLLNILRRRGRSPPAKEVSATLLRLLQCRNPDIDTVVLLLLFSKIEITEEHFATLQQNSEMRPLLKQTLLGMLIVLREPLEQ